MAPDHICQYANCDETDTPIVVSNKKALTRDRFCCAEHAALHLLRDASLDTIDRVNEQAKQ